MLNMSWHNKIGKLDLPIESNDKLFFTKVKLFKNFTLLPYLIPGRQFEQI